LFEKEAEFMSFGKLAVDWEERVNFNRMRRERVERAKAMCKRYGLDAVLLLHGDNIRCRRGRQCSYVSWIFRVSVCAFPIRGQNNSFRSGYA